MSLKETRWFIGTKWVFHNKCDENSKVVHNKGRPIAKGYNQEEAFAPIAKLEAIRMLLAFYFFILKLYQMDVKCAFLDDYLNKEVYVEQLPCLKMKNF